MLSIGKIETEIENGEDITRTNNIEVFLQLQPPVSCAASDNAPQVQTLPQTRVWSCELSPKSESL